MMQNITRWILDAEGIHCSDGNAIGADTTLPEKLIVRVRHIPKDKLAPYESTVFSFRPHFAVRIHLEFEHPSPEVMAPWLTNFALHMTVRALRLAGGPGHSQAAMAPLPVFEFPFLERLHIEGDVPIRPPFAPCDQLQVVHLCNRADATFLTEHRQRFLSLSHLVYDCPTAVLEGELPPLLTLRARALQSVPRTVQTVFGPTDQTSLSKQFEQLVGGSMTAAAFGAAIGVYLDLGPSFSHSLVKDCPFLQDLLVHVPAPRYELPREWGGGWLSPSTFGLLADQDLSLASDSLPQNVRQLVLVCGGDLFGLQEILSLPRLQTLYLFVGGTAHLPTVFPHPIRHAPLNIHAPRALRDLVSTRLIRPTLAR